MIAIDNELYYIDIKAIEDYVAKKDGVATDETKEVEVITDPKGHVLQKTTLTRTTIDDRATQIRYDLIKTMLDTTYNSGVESEEGNIKYVDEMDANSIGAKLVFNTLLINGFIKNKLD